MRLLFEIDTKDYNINGTSFNRPSVKAICIRNNKIGMIHSLKYNYYEFPGGGMEKDENHFQCLKRELREETGLLIIDSYINEYGYVHRIQKGDFEDVFIQDTYFYFVECEDKIVKQELDDYEKEERFVLEFVSVDEALKENLSKDHTGADPILIMRENKILNLLKEEFKL